MNLIIYFTVFPSDSRDLAVFLESTKIGGDIRASMTFGQGSFFPCTTIATIKLNLFPLLIFFLLKFINSNLKK